MATFISLIHFTEQGSKNIKDSTARARAFEQAAAAAGVTKVEPYWTVGSHDGVLIITADNEKQALHLLAQLNADGYVKTETMRAYGAEEFAEIIGA